MNISIARFSFKSLLLTMSMVLIAALWGGCAEEAPRIKAEHKAILKIKFDGQKTQAPKKQSQASRGPASRAGLEDDIKTVDVLSFKSDPGAPTDMKKGTFFYRAQGTMDASGYVQVQLVNSSEPQTLVVLANARKQVNALAATYGEQKMQVMNRLKIQADPTTGRITFNTADGMPMWGELQAQNVSTGYAATQATAPTVTLERMVAKITIKAGVEHVLACHYYNGYAAGRIAGDNTAGKPTVNPSDASTLTFVDYHSVFPHMGGASFYLFESDNRTKAATGLQANSFITLNATYGQARPYWYRIDLKDYDTGDFYDIVRNRHYEIEMAETGTIPSPGADTEADAIRGIYRLKCRIVPWNEVQEEVVVEGHKRLIIDKRNFTFPGDPNVAGETGQTQTLTLSTENTGGWQIKNKPAWVNISRTTGTDGAATTVTLTIAGVNPGRTDRTAVMDVVAGNLTYKIHLVQPDACGKNGVPKKMRLGNNDYYTHRFNGVCWMLENSREGRPDNILPALPGQSVQRYLWHGFNLLNDGVTGRPAGWRLPLYTDIVHLGEAMHNNATEKGIWLGWQKQPGVIAYYPTVDANGDVVGPWPGRKPLHFWQGNMPAWETRQLPRMVGYTWEEKGDISAFWARQDITDITMHSGIIAIPAATANGHAYLGCVPIVTATRNVGSTQSNLHHASAIYEPYQRGRTVWQRANELLQTYELVDRDTGQQKPPDDWQWERGYIVMRIFHGGRYWAAPSDMPWRTTAGAAFYNAALRFVFPSLNLFSAWQTNSAYTFFPVKQQSATGKIEQEFYPGMQRLGGYYPYHSAVPQFKLYIFDPIGLDGTPRRGLGAYLENRCAIRFVRAD